MSSNGHQSVEGVSKNGKAPPAALPVAAASGEEAPKATPAVNGQTNGDPKGVGKAKAANGVGARKEDTKKEEVDDNVEEVEDDGEEEGEGEGEGDGGEEEDGEGDDDEAENTSIKGKGKGKGKSVQKRPKKRSKRSDDSDDDFLEAVSKDELSALHGNIIIPRTRRRAAIASERRTASEIGKFVGRADEDDDDSDEDGEVGGGFSPAAAGAADGESDEEAELEF